MAVIFAHALSLLSFALALLLVARVGEQRRQTSNLLAWLLAILLVPYVGVPLYLVFGGRKLRRRAAEKPDLPRSPVTAGPADGPLAAMLCSSGASAPTRGNAITLLTDGEQAYAEVVRLVGAARVQVHVSTLILADDEVGRALAELFAERARGGVKVRLLVDALFKFRSSRRMIRELQAAGVEVAWFMPVWRLSQWTLANLRLHRKVVLVDGEHAIVGGMNLAREYMGPTPLPGRWRDLSLTLTGPAVGDLATIFAGDWQFASHKGGAESAPTPAGARALESAEDSSTVQVVGSGPDVASDRIYDAILTAAFGARRRLWVATPYFVPDEPLLRALVLAVRRGVDVSVVVPKKSNHLTADLAGGSLLRELAAAGGSVRCYTPGMLHAKALLIDDELAIVGSANMDMRSLFLDYEIALVLTSRERIAELEAWLAEIFLQCSPLEPAGRARAICESVARVLAPLE